jgi:hypothetical protein
MRPLWLSLIGGAIILTSIGCSGSGSGVGAGKVGRSREAAGDGPMMAEVPAGKTDAPAGEAEMTGARPRELPQSGVITAGSFDDNLHPASLQSFVRRLSQHAGLGTLTNRLRGQAVTVTVRDGDNRPVGNALVRVSDTRGGKSVTLTTRSDGRVIFHPAWDDVHAGNGVELVVFPADGSPSVREMVPANSTSWAVTMPQTRAALPRRLDLALVIDTTGSMGDEIRYLQAEVKAISQAIRDRFPEVEQRYSLVVYRDSQDEYVTRVFDFTPDLDAFHRNLSAQDANGGGDVPEAMHEGLEKALELSWRREETARVLFLLADAPPHQQYVQRTAGAIDKLRQGGVAIYPVAASGTEETTELIMRVSAMLTGSEYLFLTDDSGVGNAHAEPNIPFYHVERLDHLMTRMIAGELSGKRIAPDPERIIRTVGNPVAGNNN